MNFFKMIWIDALLLFILDEIFMKSYRSIRFLTCIFVIFGRLTCKTPTSDFRDLFPVSKTHEKCASVRFLIRDPLSAFFSEEFLTWFVCLKHSEIYIFVDFCYVQRGEMDRKCIFIWIFVTHKELKFIENVYFCISSLRTESWNGLNCCCNSKAPCLCAVPSVECLIGLT